MTFVTEYACPLISPTEVLASVTLGSGSIEQAIMEDCLKAIKVDFRLFIKYLNINLANFQQVDISWKMQCKICYFKNFKGN